MEGKGRRRGGGGAIGSRRRECACRYLAEENGSTARGMAAEGQGEGGREGGRMRSVAVFARIIALDHSGRMGQEQGREGGRTGRRGGRREALSGGR